MILRNLLPLFLLVALATSACKKSGTDDPNEVPNTDTNFSFGWAKTENDATIPNDLQFFGGNLPAKVDLTPFMPPVGDQGQTGTCVAWAVGYYTRTAMNAIQRQLSPGQIASTAQQFSPKDLFWSIPNAQKSADCNGTHFQYAFDMVQKRGVATLATVPFANLGDCSNQPANAWTQEAANFKIKSYRDLPVNLTAIKEKLAEGRPVVFGAIVTGAFMGWKGSGTMGSNILDGSERGGHAMTIVGYDDAKKAFRIVNSWGQGWGDRGFAWASYDLMTNPQFVKYCFVGYPDATVNPIDPIDPVNNTGDYDLALPACTDNDDPDGWELQDRALDFDVYNLGKKTLKAATRWSAVYLYYNAFDADDYGVLLHQYVTDEFGGLGAQGPYQDGIGEWDNWWNHVNLNPGKSLGQAVFGSKGVRWTYTMPSVDGFYYLVVIADPFETVEENNEENNLYFITGKDGGAIWFEDGVGDNLTGGGVDDRAAEVGHRTAVSAAHPNAYTPEEIRKWVVNQKKSGALATKVKAFDRKRGKGIEKR